MMKNGCFSLQSVVTFQKQKASHFPLPWEYGNASNSTTLPQNPLLPKPRCTTCSAHPRNPTPPPPRSATRSSRLPSVQMIDQQPQQPQQPQEETSGVKYGEVMNFCYFFWGGKFLQWDSKLFKHNPQETLDTLCHSFLLMKKIHPFCLNLRNHPPVSDLWASNIKSKHTKKTIAGW